MTVLFADVVGSMKFAADLDPERLREIMNDLFNRSATVVQRYQGTMDKFTGDGLMALFGAPMALEDHALRACIAALEIQAVVAELATEVHRRDGICLQLRVGLNSGDVIAGEIGCGPGRYTAVGHAVGMAQRMEAAASPGAIFCSTTTAALVERAARLGPVETLRVKGADEPVPARRLLAVEAARQVVGRNEGLMLGRDDELARLCEALDPRSGLHLVEVVGPPGVGKSRLIEEFRRRALSGGADVVLAGCDIHAKPIAFRALSRLLRAVFDVDGLDHAEARERVLTQAPMSETDAQILFESMNIADGTAPPLHVGADGRRHRLVETMREFVRLRPAPAVLVLEDVHWIDAASDAVLAEFATAIGDTSTVFVTTHRPEFHGALQRKSNRTITVAPLDESVTVDLAHNLLGREVALTDLATRIARSAAGNPYFVEEIVRDLVGRGVLAGSRGDYRLVGDVRDIGVPVTVQAVLAARIDRLEPATKSVLNAAAVIGNRFDTEALQVLTPDALSARLAELVATELIDQTEFAPRQRYCFRHPLVRTVAYQSQVSATRARAHRLLAASIESRDPATHDENAALIATHLEAAGEHKAACRWHLRAAEWLRMRDLLAARAQWVSAMRVADRLPGDDDEVTALRVAPRTMLLSTELFVGEDPDNEKRLAELRELTSRTNDARSLALALAGRIMTFIVNSNRVPEAMPLAAELADLVDALGPAPAGEREILFTALAFARFANCDFEATLNAIGRSLELELEQPSVDRAVAYAITGASEVCLGDRDQGIGHLRVATELARAMPPVSFSAILLYWGILAGMGLHVADDRVDEMGEALARAESFGDRFGIIAAQWTYGTLLLKAERPRHDEAIELLKRAEAGIAAHHLQAFALAITGPQLALEAAREGRRDEAIDSLRELVALHTSGAPLLHFGCPAEALCELLIDRGTAADLREVDDVLEYWRGHGPGTAAMDLWMLRVRALQAAAREHPTHRRLAEEYAASCRALGVPDRLRETGRPLARKG
ncbi:ATP-binding protein [Mycolicibacterium chubuense]|uniref:ATP-binding protein n=1 Tax=Mycolicibacterium chubuense TaxID=1800 RepID=UPI00130119CF|nr:adenylate/guanylate cyclase domain-containing protein [Mycolicibacterium chubuense]